MANYETVKKWYVADTSSKERVSWQSQQRVNDDIRRNEFKVPEEEKLGRTSKHIFKYNPYIKICNWMLGVLFGNPIGFTMSGVGEDDEANAEIAEMGLRWAH